MHQFPMVLATVCVALAAAGCGHEQKPAPVAKETESRTTLDHGEPSHAETGPRGGQLIELGEEEYHAELLHDDDTHVVTVYILDGEARKDVGISAPNLTIRLDSATGVDYKLEPVELDHATHATAFCYETMSEDLCHALDEEDAHATLFVNIDGRAFSGPIEHVHGHEREHDHAHAHSDRHEHAHTNAEHRIH